MRTERWNLRRAFVSGIVGLALASLVACRPAGHRATPTPSPVLTPIPSSHTRATPTFVAQPISTPSPIPPPVSADLVASLEESTTDILGFHETYPEYQEAMDAGVRIVNVPELGSFFGVWIPEGYQAQEKRWVMASVPGSNGVVYKLIGRRIMPAQEHGYAVVMVQTWMGERGVYLERSVVYSLLATALEYVGAEYGADAYRAAYEGFSLGSAMAWEIAYWDRALGTDYFDLFICHSGGMHDPGPPFIQDLRAGAWGDDVFEGQHFYMYCGMKDEEWGTAMCDYMHNAEQTVVEYGGTVERFIEDPEGSHGGFMLNQAYYEDALRV